MLYSIVRGNYTGNCLWYRKLYITSTCKHSIFMYIHNIYTVHLYTLWIRPFLRELDSVPNVLMNLIKCECDTRWIGIEWNNSRALQLYVLLKDIVCIFDMQTIHSQNQEYGTYNQMLHRSGVFTSLFSVYMQN